MENKFDNEVNFIENQYLGFNPFNLIVRLIIAGGCFFSFFTAQETLKDSTANLFLILGISVLLISILLFFVLHIKTLLVDHLVVISGYFGARIIKLDLHNFVSSEVVSYSKFTFNRPVYNLHIKGKVKFFTYGKLAVKLVDKQGLIYLIGSQKAQQLNQLIDKKLIKISKT